MADRNIMGVSVVMPVYNEESHVGLVVEELKKTLSGMKIEFEVLVVDDGSKDKTTEKIADAGVTLIRHPYNMGYGAALKTGIRHSKFERIAIIDGDGTYPPVALRALLEQGDQFDMVVAARTGQDVHIPLIRRPAKWFLTKLAIFLSGRRIPDLNSGLRVFKKKSLLSFINLLPDGFSFTTTISIAMLSQNYLVKYIATDYLKRAGRSKIRPIRDTVGFFSLIIRMVLYFNPLKVFIPLSAFLLFCDLGKIIYDIIRFNWHIATSTILLGVVGFNTLIIGLIADMIASMRKHVE